MKLQGLHTLLIPTYNRPDMLRALLTSLADSQLDIHVLDSSKAPMQDLNRRFVKMFDRWKHLSFTPETQPAAKWLAGLEQVKTPYVSFLADDDFLFPGAISKPLEMLERNAKAIAAHGVYLHFQYKESAPHEIGLNLEYHGASIQADGAGPRLVQLMDWYESPMYAVYRTSVMTEIFRQLARLQNAGYVEMFQAVAAVLKGNILRTSEPYIARRGCPTLRTNCHQDHPATWLAHDPPGLFLAYPPYRKAVVEWWQACDDSMTPEEMEKCCDVAHYIYLYRSVDPKTLHNLCFRMPLVPRKSVLEGMESNVAGQPGRRRFFQRVFAKVAKHLRKLADRLTGTVHTTMAPRFVPLFIGGKLPIQQAGNWPPHCGLPQLANHAETIRQFVKLNLDIDKKAAWHRQPGARKDGLDEPLNHLTVNGT